MASPTDPTPPPPGSSRPGILSRPGGKIEQHGGHLPDEAVHSATPGDAPPAVRFSSVTQEIEPLHTLPSDGISLQSGMGPQAQDVIRVLSQSLQRHRTSNFAFEPASLPLSRVPSTERSSPSQSNANSPALRPVGVSMQSPPLTPTEAQSREAKADPLTRTSPARLQSDIGVMTPQISSTAASLAPEAETAQIKSRSQPSSAPSSRPSTPSKRTATGVSSPLTASHDTSTQSAHRAKFTVGPTISAESGPTSPEPLATPTENYTGSATSFARPLLLQGDKDDPYARSKRPPQSRGRDGIDARFVFSGIDSKRSQGTSSGHSKSASSLPRQASSSGIDPKAAGDKRHSLSWRKEVSMRGSDEYTAKHGSMSDLKRFFGFSHKGRRSHSPSQSGKSSKSSKGDRSGTRTPPPHQLPPSIVPFADDHGLASKYGKFGKVLGSGAGGSVRLMTRSVDNVTFAVKEFRPRHAYETEREYAKKVTAEFCIGSALHHGNIIETLDIVQEGGRWYEVMELAPYDLFAVVMTGKMSRDEITCSFLQIFAGVTFLHSVGLAHRDLKLDNVVISQHGIMKIIDFGSAVTFRYPFETADVLASGVVGSDPYLAPEVFTQDEYDPQATDIWSLAVIYCCMTLKRFPWKLPRMTDNSFRMFASPPTEDESAAESMARVAMQHQRPKSTNDLQGQLKDEGVVVGVAGADNTSTEQRPSRQESGGADSEHAHHHEHQPGPTSESDQKHHHAQEVSESSSSSSGPPHIVMASPPPPAHHISQSSIPTPSSNGKNQQTVKGPWRILRLLPRESRHIIGRMLEIDPIKRATIEEMLAEPWVANSPVCRQENDGRVVLAPGHVHTLEPSKED
ncbi:MAG: hypothetical protein M1823_003269 [Watsoniomyces obsoletus]|nr:MAG: hypothetical protein M1823_003269 [Watsoniomyces obsoletus]